MAPKPKVQSKKHIARLERERRQVRLIKFIAIGVVAAVILILAYGYLDLVYLQGRQPVAEVNGEKITTNEFQARVTMQRTQLLNQYSQYLQYQQLFGLDVTQQLNQIQASLDNPSSVGQQVLDALVNEALIRQEAKRRGISVTPDEVEAFTQGQFNYYPNGTPTPTITPTEVIVTYPTLSPAQLELVTATPVPTEGPTVTPPPTATPDLSATATVTSTPAPTATPSPTATPYTLEGYQGRFDDALKGVEDIGLTEKQYRQLFETELLRSKLFDVVTADTPRVEEQVWARHILVEDEATAKTVIERLKNGEDFAALASEFSQDTGSAANGGDLGWFGKGQMVPEFETAAFNLKDGEISEPIQSQFGWHIVQTLAHADLPLTASEYQQARQTAFDNFLQNLRDESDVTIYDYWVERVPTTPSLDELQQPQ
ncbi:MAG: peptidylprolyl isomerase [Anaerolineales bacterium]|jgi:parvulin-like peptidyl-prolyl isomerase